MKKLIALALAATMVSTLCQAGNDTKRGQAGASELLINPWARSTGWNGAYAGGVRGIESMMLNVAGLAYLHKTDIAFCTQRYLSGSGISINSLGFGQRLSSTGVLGISLVSYSMGDFIETTYNLPEGTGNTFKPQFYNLGISYAKSFSKSITGGITLRTVYQAISNVNALGVAFDAGVQYQTGTDNRFKFGVAIRNVGPKMRFDGEGLSFKGTRDQIGLTVQSKSAAFEMPALLSISTGYDFIHDGNHRLTGALGFNSNSYTKDQIIPGAEYGFRDLFMVRGSYMLYQGFINKDYIRTDVYTGWAVGGSFIIPFTKKENGEIVAEGSDGSAPATPAPTAAKSKSFLSIDYSYRTTGIYNGTHAIGLTFQL